MDNEQLAQLQTRLDALERENSELKGELGLWKPSARVEVATPQDRRKAADFAKPKLNIRQFTLAEANAMSETELSRAIQNHLNEQLPNLANAPSAAVYNVKVLYPNGLAVAIKGKYKQAKIEAYKAFSHALILEKFGFVPFVSDQELRGSIF